MKLERDLMKQCAAEIAAFRPKAVVWRANSGGNKSGRKHNSINLPDFCGYEDNGYAFFVEAKKEDGRLTEEQYAFLLDAWNKGAAAYVWTPKGFYVASQIPAQHMPRTRREK